MSYEYYKQQFLNSLKYHGGFNMNDQTLEQMKKERYYFEKLADEYYEKLQHYEYVLKGIGQNADNMGNHLRANNALGIINMKGRGTCNIKGDKTKWGKLK